MPNFSQRLTSLNTAGWKAQSRTIKGNQSQVLAEFFRRESTSKAFVREAGSSMCKLICNLVAFIARKNIKPGVYDLTLEKGYVDVTTYCPERILGVVIKPGQRTVLNIVMDQGETYEEVGKPAVVTSLATNVTQELEQMQKQIEDLKQQVAALQQKLGMPAATPPVAPTAAPATPAKP